MYTKMFCKLSIMVSLISCCYAADLGIANEVMNPGGKQ